MGAVLAFGVPTWPEPRGFDLWLPVYVLFALVLIRVVVGLRITAASALAAVASGTLWSWSIDAVGVIPVGAAALLVASLAGGVVRRRPARP